MTRGPRCGPISEKTISIPEASSASRASRATRPRNIAKGLEAGGFPFELLDPQAAAARWPFLEPGTFRYAYFSTEGGALHCRKIAAGLADWLRAQGANVYENSKVVAIDAEAGRVELETGETLQADRVVVAAGAWVLKLFPELAGELKTYRTALAYVEPPADLKAAWEAAPVILDVGGKTDGYMIPPTGGAGMKFGSGLHKVPTSDADWNREPVEGEGEAIRNLFSPPIARIAEYRVTEVVTCAYTFTADECFLAHEKGKCSSCPPAPATATNSARRSGGAWPPLSETATSSA